MSGKIFAMEPERFRLGPARKLQKVAKSSECGSVIRPAPRSVIIRSFARSDKRIDPETRRLSALARIEAAERLKADVFVVAAARAFIREMCEVAAENMIQRIVIDDDGCEVPNIRADGKIFTFDASSGDELPDGYIEPVCGYIPQSHHFMHLTAETRCAFLEVVKRYPDAAARLESAHMARTIFWRYWRQFRSAGGV